MLRKGMLGVLMLGLLVLSGGSLMAQTDTTPAYTCNGAPEPRLTVGETAQVAQNFSSLRAGISSPVVLRVMYRAQGDTMAVLEGPVCSGPYNWWRVEHDGITGWVTEGTGNAYWVEPLDTTDMPVATCPGAPGPRLTVGGQGQVAQTYSTIRAGVGSPIARTIMYRSNNAVFDVIGGPICAGPHYWWEVEYNGITGWVTEGTGNAYWLAPIEFAADENTDVSDEGDFSMQGAEESEDTDADDDTDMDAQDADDMSGDDMDADADSDGN